MRCALLVCVAQEGKTNSRERHENEKDTGKKGIEAEHREAFEGQPGKDFDHPAKAPVSFGSE